MPLTGSVQVRAADATYLLNGQQVPIARTSQVCTGVATHTAFWVLVLSAAGQTLELPAFLDTTTGTPEGAFSSAKITVCLPPPDIPVERGGATFGAKLIDAQFSVGGVFQPTTGVWFGLLTPYQPGNGQPNPTGTVYTPAAVAFASIRIRLGKTPTAKRITGRLTQGGTGVPNQRVEIGAP